MRNRLTLILIIGLVLISARAFCAEHSELNVFPEAGEGMDRLVIVLPDKESGEENSFKVELIPGKIMLTDSVNQMSLGTTISARPLQGWGYTYYEVTGSDVAMSTRMAVPDGKEKIEKFVTGTSLLIRYNSRLPVVVYAPKGYEVRYRFWNAGVIRKSEKK